MTAQEQMRKMLDQLMGSGRDGESQFSLLIYSVLKKICFSVPV